MKPTKVSPGSSNITGTACPCDPYTAIGSGTAQNVLRIILAAASFFLTYLLLLLVNSGLYLCAPVPKNPHPCLRGMFSNDPVIGYVLTPNWTGVFDDGFLWADIAINSFGHRDNEVADRAPDWLLLGDSFTFGAYVRSEETIDRQIEEYSNGEINAYNTGVGGYGLPAEIETFLRCTWFRGKAVFYMFYVNDLADNNLSLREYGVHDGYLVKRTQQDGTEYTVQELEEKIQLALAPEKNAQPLFAQLSVYIIYA